MNPDTVARSVRGVTNAALVAVFSVVSMGAQAQSDARPESVPGDPAATASPFIGTFALAEYAPHGDEPIGRISYDGAGRMWAMILPPDRAPITGAASAEDYRAAMRGVVAYYGTYDVDEATGRVIHHVEAASNPAWIGDDFVRWYRFEEGDLRLSLNADFRGTLLWARMPQQ